MATLYQFPGGDGLTSLSPPCVKVEMALRYVDEPYEVTLFRSTVEARRTSPTGRVPVLDLDGRRITDSVTILDALEERHRGSPLFPADPSERTVDRLWEHFANDHVYWLGFTCRWVLPDTRERFLKAVFGRMPIPVRFAVRAFAAPSIRKRAAGQGMGLKTQDEIDDAFLRSLDMLETGLGEGPFLQGRTAPGRGDLGIASVWGQLGFRDTLPRQREMFERRPALVDHVKRVFDTCRMDRPRWLR